jgi:hypothetical protein
LQRDPLPALMNMIRRPSRGNMLGLYSNTIFSQEIRFDIRVWNQGVLGLYSVRFIPNSTDPLGLKDCSKATNQKTIVISASKDFSVNGTPGPAGGYSVDGLLDAINKQLSDCDCIISLTISAHGDPVGVQTSSSLAASPANPGGSGWLTSDPVYGNSAQYFAEKLKNLCLCSGAKIYIQSCHVGLGSVPGTIANTAGASVVSALGFAYPNGQPGTCEVSATDPHFPDPPPGSSANWQTSYSPQEQNYIMQQAYINAMAAQFNPSGPWR